MKCAAAVFFVVWIVSSTVPGNCQPLDVFMCCNSTHVAVISRHIWYQSWRMRRKKYARVLVSVHVPIFCPHRPRRHKCREGLDKRRIPL